jgi:aromatic-amino-acid transaminase
MLTVLQTLPAGTAVLLHPCCHNPTGTDLSHSQWQTLWAWFRRRDCCHFSISPIRFGAGLEEDCYALRLALESDLDFIVANSFSKNIALYGQRVGD